MGSTAQAAGAASQECKIFLESLLELKIDIEDPQAIS
jgi:hypothetical protein